VTRARGQSAPSGGRAPSWHCARDLQRRRLRGARSPLDDQTAHV